MRLSFRRLAERDLRWFFFYYGHRFPQGRRQAKRRLKAAFDLLVSNPFAGQVMTGVAARRLPVQRTPFVIVYTVVDDTIDIIRVWDARSDPAEFSEN